MLRRRLVGKMSKVQLEVGATFHQALETSVQYTDGWKGLIKTEKERLSASLLPMSFIYSHGRQPDMDVNTMIRRMISMRCMARVASI